jgi:TPR repeat protein
MCRKLNIASGFLSCVLVSLILISCSEPKVVDTWKGGEHGVTVKVETLEDGDTRVKASYGTLEEQPLEDLTAKAEEGNVDAAMALGVLYWYGAGSEDPKGQMALAADKTKAMGFYSQAAVKGNTPAKLILADLFASGASGIKQNLAEAARLYLEAAEADEARAQCRLAVMYDKGQGVQQDFSEAVRWYQECAQGGDGAAMLRLAELYDAGEGVSENKAAAAEWYRKAAGANQLRASCRLAVLYDTGQGVVQDLPEAAKLYGVCAKSGDGQAMFRLAQLHETGEGVTSDWDAALEWYRKAADADQSEAQCRLGALYDTGQGVKQDLAEAIKWYRPCAESGIGPAMFRLAEIYENALEVDNDPSLAADYMLKALKANVQQAKDEMLGGAKDWSQQFRQEFQRKLKAVNLYSGTIDGVLGQGTQKAIEAITNDNS